ncbi:hypothetical protein CYMTET_40051, partial [Cymbomonas tetramitiformis]
MGKGAPLNKPVENGIFPPSNHTAPLDPQRQQVCRSCGRRRRDCTCPGHGDRENLLAHQHRELKPSGPLSAVAQHYWAGGQPRVARAGAGAYASNLHEAVLQGDVGLLQWHAAQGEAMDQRDYLGATPLHVAVINGRLEAIQVLLDLGADIHCGDNHNVAAIHHAGCLSSPSIAETLLQRGANIMTKDSCGRTPLHYATNTGHVDTAVFLLTAGARMDAMDGARRTALDVAKSPDVRREVESAHSRLVAQRLTPQQEQQQEQQRRWAQQQLAASTRVGKAAPRRRGAKHVAWAGAEGQSGCPRCGRPLEGERAEEGSPRCTCEVSKHQHPGKFLRQQADLEAAQAEELSEFAQGRASEQSPAGRYFWHDGSIRVTVAGAQGRNVHEEAREGDAAALRARGARGETLLVHDFLGATPLHHAAAQMK